MTRTDPRLTGLARISEAMCGAALARLGAASADLHRVESEIAALANRPSGAGATDEIAFLAVAGAAHARWQAARRAALARDLERARAIQAAALEAARRALGRDAAIGRLLRPGR